jgi:tetratricopeptide (TPR) repeat protein
MCPGSYPMDRPEVLGAADWFEKGLHALVEGRNEEAVEAFTEAIGYKPDDAETFGYRGCAFYNLGSYISALNDYEIALALEPSLFRVRFFRGIVYQNHRRYDEAIEDFTKALEGDRLWDEAYYHRGINRGLLNDQQGALHDLVFAARLGYEPAQKFLARKGIVWQILSL